MFVKKKSEGNRFTKQNVSDSFIKDMHYACTNALICNGKRNARTLVGRGQSLINGKDTPSGLKFTESIYKALCSAIYPTGKPLNFYFTLLWLNPNCQKKGPGESMHGITSSIENANLLC